MRSALVCLCLASCADAATRTPSMDTATIHDVFHAQDFATPEANDGRAHPAAVMLSGSVDDPRRGATYGIVGKSGWLGSVTVMTVSLADFDDGPPHYGYGEPRDGVRLRFPESGDVVAIGPIEEPLLRAKLVHYEHVRLDTMEMGAQPQTTVRIDIDGDGVVDFEERVSCCEPNGDMCRTACWEHRELRGGSWAPAAVLRRPAYAPGG